jgi:hypothetical protein
MICLSLRLSLAGIDESMYDVIRAFFHFSSSVGIISGSKGNAVFGIGY